MRALSDDNEAHHLPILSAGHADVSELARARAVYPSSLIPGSARVFEVSCMHVSHHTVSSHALIRHARCSVACLHSLRLVYSTTTGSSTVFAMYQQYR